MSQFVAHRLASMIAVLTPVDLAAVVVVGLVILLALWRSNRRIEAKVGQVSLSVDDVNKAVNQRPEGEPTLYQQVQQISEQVAETQTQTVQIDRKLGEHLAYHRGVAESSRPIQGASHGNPQP